MAFWDFDDGSATDKTGNGHDGTVHGATSDLVGISGSALRFDGDDDYVTFDPDPVWNTAPLTVCAWVNPTSINTGAFQYIMTNELGGYYGFTYCLTPAGEWKFRLSTPAGSWYEISHPADPSPPWTFLCATWDGTYVDFYVNDDIVTSGGGWHSGDPRTSGFLVMGRKTYDSLPGVEQYPFDGLIDEVHVYSAVLERDEITFLYEHPGGCFPPTAVIDEIAPSPAELGEQVSFTGHGIPGPYTHMTDCLWESFNTSTGWTTLSEDCTFNTTDLAPGQHLIGLIVTDNVGCIRARQVMLKVVDGVVYRPRSYGEGHLFEPELPGTGSVSLEAHVDVAQGKADVNPDSGAVVVYGHAFFGWYRAIAAPGVVYSVDTETRLRVTAELQSLGADFAMGAGGHACDYGVTAYNGLYPDPDDPELLYANAELIDPYDSGLWMEYVGIILAFAERVVPIPVGDLWDVVQFVGTVNDWLVFQEALSAANSDQHLLVAEFTAVPGAHLLRIPLRVQVFGVTFPLAWGRERGEPYKNWRTALHCDRRGGRGPE